MTITGPTGGRPEADAPSSGRARLRYAAAAILIAAISGLLGGWLWAELARPPAGLLSSTGVVFGETELDKQVGVTMWFLVTGMVMGVVLGVALSWRGSRHGVTAVLAVLIGCCVASLVSYWSGAHLFGPDAKAQLASAAVGQRITAPVTVGTKIAFLGWPIGGLIGALAAISWWPRTRGSSAPASVTRDVVTD